MAVPHVASVENEPSGSRRVSGGRQAQAEARLQQLRDTLTNLEDRRKDLSEQVLMSDAGKLETGHITISEALEQAKKINREHIRLLNQYNDIKDVSTSLIGMIAENQQKRIIEVMQDFGVDEND